MTAYHSHPGQFIPANQIIAANVAQAKQRRREMLDQVERQRTENCKRFLEKQRKIALEASGVI